MKNDYRDLEKRAKPHYLKKVSGHPLFGFVVLSLALIALQLFYMFTDGIISLTVSRAICTTMIYSVAAMGLGILVGLAGLTSLGSAAFVGAGGYVAGNILKAMNLPFVAILLGVIVVGVIVGLGLGIISLRIRGLHLMIITLAFAQILNELFRVPNNFTGGPNGLTTVPYPKLLMFIELNRNTVYFLVLAVMFILIVITMNIINSPMGRAMLAMSNSESLAQSVGIRVLRFRVLAFVIATVYALIAGALFVSFETSVQPASWTVLLSLNMLVAVVLGGSASPAGTILGAFIIFGLDLAILKNIPFFIDNPNASMIFAGVLIILIVMKYPGGLMRLLGNIKNGTKKLFGKWRVYTYGPDA